MDIHSSGRINAGHFFIPLLAIGIFLLLTLPVWRWLWQEWMGNTYYSHGFLIPPLSLFLALQCMRRDSSFAWIPGQNSFAGMTVLAVSLTVFLYALNNKAFYIASFAMIGLIVGLVWTTGGIIAISKLIFPILYLGFMIPLPFIDYATLPLALFTGICSSGLVRLLGLDVTIVGNAVTLPNADLVIGAQCSGINSMITLIALTTLAAYLFHGPWWGRILLVFCAIPLALLGNILRVSSLLFVARSYGVEVGFSFYHDYSGGVFFVVALVLLYPLAKLLQCRTLRSEVI